MQHRLWSRRTALRMAGLVALSVGGLGYFKSSPARTAIVQGYGPDPNLLERTVTWPRTLSAEHFQMLTLLCDIVLPAEPPHPSAAEIATPEFLDEWLSAPYPDMKADRRIIIDGLDALNAATRGRWGTSFCEIERPRQISTFDTWCSGNELQISFCRRLIALVCSGYYTTREGHAAVGYVGNIGRVEFPGPPPEVVHKFQQALREQH